MPCGMDEVGKKKKNTVHRDPPSWRKAKGREWEQIYSQMENSLSTFKKE